MLRGCSIWFASAYSSRAAATTSLLASALSGLAAAATSAVLGWLVHDGQMALAVAGTAVVGIRTGAADVTSLVRTANGLYEEALFVADLERLQREAERRAIPTGGADLPHRPDTISLEGVGFTYPGRSTPALTDITLQCRDHLKLNTFNALTSTACRCSKPLNNVSIGAQ